MLTNYVTLANLCQAGQGLVAALFLRVCSDCIVTQVGQCNIVCQHGIRINAVRVLGGRLLPAITVAYVEPAPR